MATELDSRLWFSESQVSEVFLKLIHIVSENKICSNEWKNLVIKEAVPGKTSFEQTGEVSLGELKKIASNFNTSSTKLTIYVPIECWRFAGLKSEYEHVMMAVSCWGRDYGSNIGFDQEIEGNAQISVLSAGPYCAIENDDGKSELEKVNLHVAENLENLISLFQDISLKASPQKILTFSDAGQYILSNVHMSYFSRYEDIKTSILHFMSIMRDGLVNYNLKPMAKADPAGDSFLFHEWRSVEQRHALKSSLEQVNITGYKVNNEGIRDVLQSGKYDFFDREEDESLLVLNYPYFMNAFIADFFVDVIKSSAKY